MIITDAAGLIGTIDRDNAGCVLVVSGPQAVLPSGFSDLSFPGTVLKMIIPTTDENIYVMMNSQVQNMPDK
jgi:hypothetical protein